MDAGRGPTGYRAARDPGNRCRGWGKDFPTGDRKGGGGGGCDRPGQVQRNPHQALRILQKQGVPAGIDVHLGRHLQQFLARLSGRVGQLRRDLFGALNDAATARWAG